MIPIGIIPYPNLFQTKTHKPVKRRGGAGQEPFYVGQLRKFDAERSAGSIACKEAGPVGGVRGRFVFGAFRETKTSGSGENCFFFDPPPPQPLFVLTPLSSFSTPRQDTQSECFCFCLHIFYIL